MRAVRTTFAGGPSPPAFPTDTVMWAAVEWA